MTYQVLARKWRPQTFAEVVGQEHITRTLQNAIQQGRVGHAYLFVGSRGIGKTTTARIFAKALNCDTGVSSEPCCKCQSCIEIADGTSLDVIEIDGASHNKVDDVRDIRDNVQYTPTRSRYKIYIIDEVHMLTTAAWNALLKTLEEPPPHVKFLFATTEPHKVLPTIVSRCQRFDLKRIPVPLIADRLKQIAASEQVSIDDGALAAIARAAEGGMRDAQSIFDQMIAFSGGQQEAAGIREQDVIDVFGLASGAELKEITGGLLANELQRVLAVVHGLADRGRDLERLYADLIGYTRNVMVCSICPDPSGLVEVSESALGDLCAVSRSCASGVTQRILQGLVAQEWSLRSALNKRVYLEATLARVMVEAHGVQMETIIARLNELRQGGLALGGSPSAPPAPAAAARPPSGASPRPQPPAAAPPRPVAAPQPATASASPTPVSRAPDRPQPPASPGPREAAAAQPPAAAAPVVGEEPAVTKPAAAAPEPAAAAPLKAAATKPVGPAAPAAPAARPEPVVAEPAAPAVSPPAGPAPAPPAASTPRSRPSAQDPVAGRAPAGSAAEPARGSPGDVSAATEATAATDADPVKLWHELIQEVDNVPGKHQLKLYMQEFKPVSCLRGVLHVAYDEDVPAEHVAKLQEPDTVRILQKCYSRISPVPGGKVLLKRWIETVSNGVQKRRLQSSPELREKLEQNPFVRDVCQLFDASIVDVRG